MVEVELGVGLGLDQHELEPLAEVDDRVAAVERGDAQADPLEGAALARAFGVEERQLPRRASAPSSVNRSVCSITRSPIRAAASAIRARSATQSAT